MRRRHPPPYRYRRRQGLRHSTVVGILMIAAAIAGGVFVIASRGSSAGSQSTVAADAGAGAGPRHHRATSHRHTSAADRTIARVERYTNFVARGSPRRRAIALTFDDGPGPYTPRVMHVLLRMHAPATFFVVGQELHDFAGALRQEIRYGFPVGDHTQNHAWLMHLNASGQRSQIDDVARELERYGAPAPRLFRPPYGAFNQVTLSTLKSLRMLMVLWSVDPSDWRRPGAGAIAANVLSHARPGAIVILHDGGGDRSQTVAALPAIINGLRRRHYGLVTVPRLLALDPPPRRQTPPHLSGV